MLGSWADPFAHQHPAWCSLASSTYSLTYVPILTAVAGTMGLRALCKVKSHCGCMHFSLFMLICPDASALIPIASSQTSVHTCMPRIGPLTPKEKVERNLIRQDSLQWSGGWHGQEEETTSKLFLCNQPFLSTYSSIFTASLNHRDPFQLSLLIILLNSS